MRTPAPTVRFRDWTCTAEFRRYRSGGGIGIQLFDIEDGCPVATATTNPEQPLPVDHVAIKDWSENEGILTVLVAAGIVADTGRRIPCGYADAALCRLLVDPAV